MRKASFYVINGITYYRIIVSPLLLVLIFIDHLIIFKWLLALSFFTDLIDGYLARKYKVVSKMGATIDSIGDNLTFVVAIIAMFVFRLDFIKSQLALIVLVLSLFAIQTLLAVFRYGKLSSFHTYAAKATALLVDPFLILLFFLPQPYLPLFYVMASIAIIDLVEEIILVILLPRWQTNVKGLYWVLKGKNNVRV